MHKPVTSVVPHAFRQAAPGLRGVDLFARDHPIDPFLVVTEFHMDRAVFGPHPHAGITVLTYLLPESTGAFINRDSLGDRSVIEPGGVHATQAGRGVHHDEVPRTPGVDCHGFQIWINHREEDRFVEPASFHASAAEVPVVQHGGAAVRVVQGRFGGQRAPFEGVTPVALLDVSLERGARLTLEAGAMAFLYGTAGDDLRCGEHTFGAQALVLFDDSGDEVVVEAGRSGGRVLFASGTPLREPVAYGGPFVMTTPAQLAEARRLYAAGQMGTLAGP